MVLREANKYEFGDQGSIMLLVNDKEGVNEVRYSSDLGKTWKSLIQLSYARTRIDDGIVLNFPEVYARWAALAEGPDWRRTLCHRFPRFCAHLHTPVPQL